MFGKNQHHSWVECWHLLMCVLTHLVQDGIHIQFCLILQFTCRRLEVLPTEFASIADSAGVSGYNIPLSRCRTTLK